MKARADIGVFGGSGFYEFLSDVEEVWVDTPYGMPSDRVAIAEIAGRRVAFLPRHGRDHRLPPHKINYRANLWAMKELGVSRILGPCAAGSLQPHVKPGDFVICDQFVHRTWGRADTFFEGPTVTHVSAADPYCDETRQTLIEQCGQLGLSHHNRGTVVVVQGPRFSTRAGKSRVPLSRMGSYQHDPISRGISRQGTRYMLRQHLTDYRLRRRLRGRRHGTARQPPRSAESVPGQHRATPCAARRDHRGAADGAQLPLRRCGERRDRLIERAWPTTALGQCCPPLDRHKLPELRRLRLPARCRRSEAN